MKKEKQKKLRLALCLLGAFCLWTVLVRLADRAPIGPHGSAVGLATVNKAVHDFIGVHLALYTVTDWLGLIPVGFMIGFAICGLLQWVQRKCIWKVDRSILVLGGFYVVTIAAYIFFEMCIVNYRPILIEGRLEASYPSSTTLLVLCVMPTAMMQLHARIQSGKIRRGILCAMGIFCMFMVIARLFSGVHWVTDIIGGVLFSAGLVMLYAIAVGEEKGKREENEKMPDNRDADGAV